MTRKRVLKSLIASGLAALCLTNSGAQDTWTLQDSPTTEWLSAVIYNVQLDEFVAVGENGVVLKSSDGENWDGFSSGLASGFVGITFADEQYVAVGAAGLVATSPDATVWTERPTMIGRSLSAVAYGNGLYVAVGVSGTIQVSEDAINWDLTFSTTGETLLDVIFSAGRFVACGSGGKILVSTNGRNWAAAESGSDKILANIDYVDGRYLACGQLGEILTSPDASTWTHQESGSSELLRAAASGNQFTCVPGALNTLITSSDLMAWQPRVSGVPGTPGLADVAFGQDKFVIVGDSHLNELSEQVGTILTSGVPAPEGVEWTQAETTFGEDDGSVILVAERTGTTASVLNLTALLTPGSASEGDDYVGMMLPLTFSAGSATAQVTIPIIPDDLLEGLETFRVEILPGETGVPLLQPWVQVVRIIDAEDTDNDGLPDDWEITHFGNITSQNSSGDPDGDDNDNLTEFLDGTNPNDPNSALYAVEVEIIGFGVVSQTPDLAKHPRGSEVLLTPQGFEPFEFGFWSGDATGSDAPLLITVDSTKSITAKFEFTLETALDQPGLVWSTSGTGGDWVPTVEFFDDRIDTTNDGIDSAQAGTLEAGEFTTLSTEIEGPAVLTFFWQSNLFSQDHLRFFIDGAMQEELTGFTAWNERTFTLSSGSHTIAWTLTKNSPGPQGDASAWVDQVSVGLSFELWLEGCFTQAQMNDPMITGPDADPDGDGRGNLFEFTQGTSPKVADFAPDVVDIEVRDIEGTPFAEIDFRHLAIASPSASFTLQRSDDLGPWDDVVATPEIIAVGGGFQIARFRDPDPILGDERRGYRIKVELNQP